MNNRKSKTFRKRAACPASETLLLYAGHSLPTLFRQRVALHLSSCDFCNAELHLLSRHPPADDRQAPAEMPVVVRLLMSGLLSRTASASRRLSAA